MKFPGRQVVSLLLPFFALPFSLFVTGCSSSPATLTVRSNERNVSYAQTFSQAFAAQSEDGTHEFVLVSDDAVKSAPKDPGAPLQPIEHTPLRQVVYIRVLWQPLNGVERGVAKNASLDWFVFANTAGGSDDVLEYQGTACATVKAVNGGEATTVTLHDGALEPHAARGDLTDPVGPARLQGRFTAVKNPHRVQELLAAARARTAEASAAAR
jgi:hypothetical protein